MHQLLALTPYLMTLYSLGKNALSFFLGLTFTYVYKNYFLYYVVSDIDAIAREFLGEYCLANLVGIAVVCCLIDVLRKLDQHEEQIETSRKEMDNYIIDIRRRHRDALD
eukprot:PhF_6_TR40002/c0_g1_i1/m.59369